MGCQVVMLKNIILFICISTTVVSGFSQKLNQDQLDQVTLHLKWSNAFQFAGYYAAKQQGFYANEGLDVTIIEASPKNIALDNVLSGKAQYGVWSSEILNKRLSGSPLVVLAAIFQHSPYIILSKKDRNIRVPSDLFGCTIQAEKGMGTELLYAMLVHEGIDTTNINVVPGAWDLNPLIEGNVDASVNYITDEPHTLAMQGIDVSIMLPSDYGIDFYGDCLFTTENEIENHPERVKAFRQASLDGWKYAMKNVDELIDLILTLPSVVERGITRQHLVYEAEQMADLVLPNIVDVGHINPGRWKHIADTYVKLGMLNSNYSLNGFIYDPNPPKDRRWMWGMVFVLFGSLFIAIAGWIGNHQLRKVVTRRTDDLLQSQKRALESDRLKSAFLANMSHEIRTPMNGIIGFTELLKEPDIEESLRDKYLDIIDKSGDRLLSIIDALLDISKIDAGQMEVFYSQLRIEDFLKEIHLFFWPEANSKGLKLSIDIPQNIESMTINTDKDKLYSVLTNLITNAIKYTNSGTITIGFSCETSQNIFYVRDTGIGIPKDRQQEIFGRFVQAHNDSNKINHGVGLGLYMTKTWIELLGGEIGVDSDDGKGSTFRFTLPIKT